MFRNATPSLTLSYLFRCATLFNTHQGWQHARRFHGYLHVQAETQELVKCATTKQMTRQHCATTRRRVLHATWPVPGTERERERLEQEKHSRACDCATLHMPRLNCIICALLSKYQCLRKERGRGGVAQTVWQFHKHFQVLDACRTVGGARESEQVIRRDKRAEVFAASPTLGFIHASIDTRASRECRAGRSCQRRLSTAARPYPYRGAN